MVFSNPKISQIIELGDSWWDFIKEIREEEYDYIIDLHNNLRTLFLKILVESKYKTFKKLNFAKWLLVHFKINRMPDRHIVDRYLDTVKDLGIVNDNMGLDFKYRKPNVFDEQFMDNYEVFAIGGQHNTKKLPNERIVQYLWTLDAPIYLLGGKEDIENGKAIAKEIPHVFNLCGKTDLALSAYIIERSVRVHTHDTGMMHIAAALNKPIVSFWGSTVPEFGMYPYFKNQEVPKGSKIYEVKGLSCRPCSKIGYDKCPKGHFKCMNDIELPKDERY